MENQIPAYEGNLIYDFEETDPRYCVEFLKPCPNLSPNTTVYFDGFFWNECGIVFHIRKTHCQKWCGGHQPAAAGISEMLISMYSAILRNSSANLNFTLILPFS